MDSESSVSLNVDIMHVVMSYATRDIVSNLMKSCRILNSEGARHLLRDGVSIGCEADLSSFVFFLAARNNSADFFRHLSFFDSLSLRFDFPSEEVAFILAHFFEKVVSVAFNFTSLDIHTAEALLTAYPPLGAAIAKLATLESLKLSSAGEHCAELLRTLQSKLVTATVGFGDSDREEDVPECDRNPILLLRRSQSTLQSLDTSFSASSLRGPCYTNVSYLSLSYMDLPEIEDYIRAFPNLHQLSAFECSGYMNDPEIWEDRRMTSIEYQARHGTWQCLRRYWGSVLILWLFGLTCRIPSVELDFEDDELDLAKLNDVLHDVRPTRLVLKLSEASCILDGAFRSAICTDRDLRVLDLWVSFSSEKDSTLFVGDILDALVDVVRASSATSFKLSLDWSWVAGMERMGRGAGLPTMPFEGYLQDMDVDAYADTLFASVASLKNLQVSIVGPKWYRRQADRGRT